MWMGCRTQNILMHIIWTDVEDISISASYSFTKTTSTVGYAPGEYTCKVLHNYGDNQNASAEGIFTVNEPVTGGGESEGGDIPLGIIAVSIIVLIIVFFSRKEYCTWMKRRIKSK